MKPDHDTNDTPPEASSYSAWDDADKNHDRAQGPRTVLPDRRSAEETAPQPPTNHQKKGLNIEPLPLQKSTTEDVPHPPSNHQKKGLRFESSMQPFQKDNPALEVRQIGDNTERLNLYELDETDTSKKQQRWVFLPKGTKNPLGSDGVLWGLAKKYSLKWILGISIGVGGLVVIAHLISLNQSIDSNTNPGKDVLTIEPDINQEDPYLYMLNRQDEAMKIYSKFMTDPCVDDIIPLVRDGMALEPIIRARQRSTLSSKNWAPGNDSKWMVREYMGRLMGRLTGKLPDQSRFDAYFVLSNEHLVMDWKASTGYGTATFDELAQNQGNPAEIRSSINPSVLYSHIFQEAEFQSYLLVAPDTLKKIWCYARRGEPAHEALSNIFKQSAFIRNPKQTHKVTLRLERGPEGALPDQWILAELLHMEWICP